MQCVIAWLQYIVYVEEKHEELHKISRQKALTIEKVWYIMAFANNKFNYMLIEFGGYR